MNHPNKSPRHSEYNKSASRALNSLWTLALTISILCACFFGKEVIIPMALASLVAFLLIPWVTWLEKKIGIVTSVVSTMLLLIMVSVGIGWMVAAQAIDLAEKLPDYKDNLHQKLQIFKIPKSKTLANLEATLLELRADLPGAKPTTDPKNSPKKTASPKEQEPEPMPVRLVEPNGGIKMLNFLGNIASPILGPLSDTAMVFLLATFMLLKHDDIRSRLFRLFSHGNIGKTSRVMDEAASKVRRYLLMQLVVNVTYGLPLGIGLYCLGVPNAFLWGALAAVLRFIPYIGPWIAALFPVLLSLAVSPSWLTPIFAIALFLLLELLSNNLLEPWLYGSSTGVSSMALIVSAVFWTWLWGVPGLILATPITVCLVVMGRHIPKLEVLAVLMGEDDVLDPVDECYQRLAREGRGDEIRFTENYLKDHPLDSLYDEVLIPVLIHMDQDLQNDNLHENQYKRTFVALQELVEDMGNQHVQPTPSANSDEDQPASQHPSIGLISPSSDRDQIGLQMVDHILKKEDCQTSTLSSSHHSYPNLEMICLSAVYPVKIRQIRRMVQSLRQANPDTPLCVGIWGYPADTFDEDVEPLLTAGATRMFSTMKDMANHASS